MEKKWTPEQQKIITLRNRNLLVSASAGAGKTAALVARILAMLEEGVSITSLLVLTFTKAAAAEMRKRVWEELEEKAAKEGAKEHLRKQLSLLPDAYITTIHSFCQNIIRNYFHLIDLDPAFRIGEEAELILLRADVLADLLEQRYEEGSESFLEFLECYAGGKSDEALETLVLKLYDISRGYPWPEEWLASQSAMYQVSCLRELEETALIQQLCQYLHEMIEDAIEWNQKALGLCRELDGPAAYLDALSEDQETLSLLHRAKSYQEYVQCFSELSFVALSRKKQADASDDKKEEVKLLRKQMKDLITKLKKEFFFQPLEEMLKDMKIAEKSVQVLTSLVSDFAQQYSKKKEEKNLFDFSDLEHFALKILHTNDNNKILPTLAAVEVSRQFTEIMVDEYQDSNLVQEIILSCISREQQGQPNTFMVGDVKQSIYKFRLAKPELFLEKYHSYSKEDSRYQKIILQHNYRSRPLILNGVNYIFERIMRQQLGGISYDEEARLNAGAVFMPCPEGRESKRTELLLVTEEREDSAPSEEEADEFFLEEPEEEIGLRELEAKAAAMRIQKMVHNDTGLMITSEGGYRAANYGDVVILLRAMTGWLETFVRVLEEEGIPVYSDQQSGYFLAIEIRTVLNYLRILDNPRQEIAFAAVLYSKIAGMRSEELAQIRILDERISLYEAAKIYCIQGEDTLIKKKLKEFFSCYDELRQKVCHSKVGELILEIYERTGFYHYVAAMPGGERRQGNLEMLLEQAAVFEAGSYSGLFQFVRYVERLLKKNIDYGESISYDGSNAVRITSIHKSKGLEYPVVILAGMGKLFNHQDIREKIVIHSDYGLGLDCIDFQKRTKIETLQKKVLQRFTVLENLGEELRLFYVAMTRAKEKLILLGSIKQLNKTWNKYVNTPDFLPYSSLAQARSYLDYAAPVILKECFIPMYGEEMPDKSGLFSITILKEADLKQQPEEKQARKIKELQLGMVSEVSLQNTLQECLLYQYPFTMDIALPIKISVSELKKLSQQEEAKENEIELPQFVKEETRTLPAFLQKENVIHGADRGTLYHRILEKITPCKAKNKEQIVKAIVQLMEQGILSEQEKDVLVSGQVELEAFYTSKLAGRMRQAEEKNLLFLEQPFVMGIPYHQVQEAYEGNETIMIQGMIDAYFEELDGLVLVDYKTDRIAPGDEEVLVKRYHKQFYYYEQALCQLTGKPIKEKIIFSFSLLKEIKMM